jgi:hypothetical protein
MRRMLWLCLTGLALCGGSVFGQLPQNDYIKRTVLVEVRGKLRLVDTKAPNPAVRLLSGGTEYHLDFDDASLRKRARKLDGRTVLVKGTLRERVIAADSLDADEGDYVIEKTFVKVKGEITESRTGGPSPDWQISANGRRYDLVFNPQPELLELAKQLRGRTVVLAGTLGSESPREIYPAPPPATGKEEPGPRVPQAVPILAVTSLTFEGGTEEYVVQTVRQEMCGTVLVKRDSSNHLVVGEQTYRLDFGAAPGVEGQAAKLVGQKAVVTGKLESRSTPFGTTEQVLVVANLRAAYWW